MLVAEEAGQSMFHTAKPSALNAAPSTPGTIGSNSEFTRFFLKKG
jgi:hypothetical protein